MKKILSVVLCLCILVSAVSMVSYAVDKPKECVLYGGTDSLSFPEDSLEMSGYVTAKQFYSNTGNTWLFKSQLSALQKKVYDAIVAQEAGLNNGGKFTIDFTGTTASSESELGSIIVNALAGGISAAIDDYPEYFWMGGYKNTVSYSYDSNGYYPTTVTVTFNVGNTETADYASFAYVKAAYNAMQEAINTFTVTGSSRYEKVKSIHDKICNTNSYDHSFASPMAHHPTGYFLNNISVCEGYAEAFKLICDREGIPCIIVTGTGRTNNNTEAHEWNEVQMDDGKWYGVDVTWDDQTEDDVSPKIYYDFFLVGSGSKSSSAFGSLVWSTSHQPNGTHLNGTSFRLNYPTLADTKYTPGQAVDISKSTLKLGKVTNAAKGITITWNALSGVEGYKVYRKEGTSGWKIIKSGITATSYTDTTAKSGTKYTYTVRGYVSNILSKYNTTGLTLLRLANPVVKLANTNDGVKVSWGKITGAKTYYVYRKDSSSSYKKIASTTSLSYVDKTAKAGTRYAYTVRAVNGTVLSAYTGVITIRLTTPSFSLANTKSGPKITWSKVTGAKGYLVYRKTGSGSYSKIASTTSLSYIDKTAKAGTKYTYTVKAYNGSYASAYTGKAITVKK